MSAEELRLKQSRERTAHWKRWGPYLSERAWGTVREDYSPYGKAWEYLSHDHARSLRYGPQRFQCFFRAPDSVMRISSCVINVLRSRVISVAGTQIRPRSNGPCP